MTGDEHLAGVAVLFPMHMHGFSFSIRVNRQDSYGNLVSRREGAYRARRVSTSQIMPFTMIGLMATTAMMSDSGRIHSYFLQLGVFKGRARPW
mgnify:CR=1 FL=1